MGECIWCNVMLRNGEAMVIADTRHRNHGVDTGRKLSPIKYQTVIG